VAGKGPPPDYSLNIPISVQKTIPAKTASQVEEAIRTAKRTRLYRTRALLPALEIVRQRQNEFQAAARSAGLDDRLFQGLIVLECGGREDAIDYMFRQGRGRRAHVGLGQMGWIEARSAGLKVAPRFEELLKKEIRHSITLIRENLVETPKRTPEQFQAALWNSVHRQRIYVEEWRGQDERFDPQKNLKATAQLLKARLRGYKGDVTLAVAAYHAGGGNISRALRLYRLSDKTAKNVNYWSLFADRTGPVYQFMSGWSDDSRNYLPKVLAAADIVEKYLQQPEAFRSEYLYWGPDDAGERLAALPYPAVKPLT
jgi:hypothetical protein